MADHSDESFAALHPAIPDTADPFGLFAEWFAAASGSEPNDPNGMALATVDETGLPSVRMVLLKGVDDGDTSKRGFVFYTNFESAKGRELLSSRKAAICFHWKSLRRQVRARGLITLVSAAEADAYFASRHRESRIGAWASQQSRALVSPNALPEAVAAFTAKFAAGDVPRPPYWSGFRLTPLEIEFWQDRPYRLHDRLQFRRAAVSAPWQTARLYP